MTHDFPSNLVKYSQSPVFTEITIPDALRRDHSTKADVWGKIVVTDGALVYLRHEKPAQTVHAGEIATIFPEEPHHVTPKGNVEFQVEFYRAPNEGAGR